MLRNLWGIIGLGLCGQLLLMGGMLLCFVGLFLAYPVIMAGQFIAYRKIFGGPAVAAAPLEAKPV